MKEHLERVLPRNPFVRSVSVLAGGTVISQAIIVLTSPLLTRLYSPEDFGVLAVYTGILGTLAVVASLRYQLAIPLPQSDAEAASIAVLSLLVVFMVTTLSALLVFAFGGAIVDILNTPALAPYLWLLPLGLILMGVYEVLNFWAIRMKAFPVVARTKLAQAVSMVAVQLGGFMLGPVALLLGQLTGQAAGSTSLGALAVRKRWFLFRAVRLGDIRHAAHRYRRFPIFSSWGGAFNTAGTQLPLVLFAALFHPAAAGIYMLAQRVIAMPARLLGGAVADVFYASAADARREGRLAPLVAEVHHKLAHIAMPPALILVLAAPDLFALVFGAEWRQAGEFARWLAPWFYFQFITSPLSRLFSVLERQVHGMAFQGVLLITRIASIAIGAYYGDIILAVGLFGAGSALCFMGLFVMLARASGNAWTTMLRPTIDALAWSVVFVAPLALFYALAESQVLWMIAFALSLIMVASRYSFLLRHAW